MEDIAICMVGHLLISFPSGRLQGRTQKAFVGFIYFLSAPLDLIIYYLLSDQADCYACRRNLGIVHYGTGSPSPVDWLLMPTVALVCAAVLWTMFRRWRRASPLLQRSLGPALAGGGLLISVIAVQRIGVADRAADVGARRARVVLRGRARVLPDRSARRVDPQPA